MTRVLFLTALIATAGVARAQTTDDVSIFNTNLGLLSGWSSGFIANSNSAVTFDSSLWSLSSLFTSGFSSTTWNSIVVDNWSSPLAMNTGNSNLICLTGSTAISLIGQSLSLGCLNIDNVNSNTIFNLQNGHSLTLDGALGTNSGWTETATVNGGGVLCLNGNSNANGGSNGNINLTCENGSGLSFGGNQSQNFCKLTIDNDSSTVSLNCTTKTQECFTGGLFINPNTKMVITGWQGGLGQSGTCGELFFSKTNQLLNYELTNVEFDLSSNKCGPTSSSYCSTPNYDYGMWITDPNCSSLYELVPYCAVPEPKTVLAGLALLAVIGWRERRRLAGLYARFLPQMENA